MSLRVLITAPYMQPVLERFMPALRARGIEVVVPEVVERLDEAQLLALVGDVDGVVCGDDAFTARVLDAAPRLRVLSKWGTGIDSIDQDACSARGVAVRNTSDAFTEPVADSALGYVLSFARRLPWMDRAMKGGAWEKLPGRALGECTLGIVGVGHIGKAVARRARAFGMTLLGNDPLAMPPDFVAETGIAMVELPQLLAQADFVSLHCDLNPTSRQLIDAAALSAMQPHAVLINTARGALVDEAALATALGDGRIAGAAMDVFEQEPLPAESPLRALEQVMIAPHNSNSSPRAWERVHRSTLDNLFDVLGLPPLA
jgi:D-3-phosphoglycerate dehydrogenase